MKVRRPYAFCCIEGGGRVSGCMCSNPDHGFATVEVKSMLPGDEPVLDEIDEAAQPAEADGVERQRQHGAHLFNKARELGWQDDGEGPYEYVVRTAYAAGLEAATPPAPNYDLRAENERLREALRTIERGQVLSVAAATARAALKENRRG